MTRLVDRADGWMPIGMGAERLTSQWRQLRELAAERGRTAPIETVVRVNAQYTPKAYDGADRSPFQGSVAQIVEDLGAHAESGLPEFFFELQGQARDVQELKDVAAEIYEAVRAAEI